MINTYIYGSPHGFNFFEGVASLNDYFKGFYISSRRGRRLMVNRKSDGTTIYSFLCYGLMEVAGRPNAFFGCSIVTDDNKFTPELKELFEWFDYLFAKIIERGRFFKINDDEVLQYKIDRFSDASDETEWLKSNLPNFFTRQSDVKLLSYDSSFSQQNSGKVACMNIDSQTSKIIAEFKRMHWLALSPNFAMEEESEEVNIGDLREQLNDKNHKLLSMAVTPTIDMLPALRAIKDECYDALNTLRKYATTTIDETEKMTCSELIGKYKELENTLNVLITKLNTLKNEGKKTGNTSNGIINGHINTNDNRNTNGTTNGNQKPDTRGNSEPIKRDRLNNISPKAIAGFTIFIIVLVIAAIFALKGGNSESKESSDAGQDQVTVEEVKFNQQTFDNYLTDGRVNEATQYVVDFGCKAQYANAIREAIFTIFYDLLDATDSSQLKFETTKFIKDFGQAISGVGIDSNELQKICDNYCRLVELAKKTSLTDAERNEALKLVESLPEAYRLSWSERINSIPNPNTGNNGRIEGLKVTIINSSEAFGEGVLYSKNTYDSSQTLEFKAGTYITFQYPKIVNNKPLKKRCNTTGTGRDGEYSIKLDKTSITDNTGQFIFSLNNKQITITIDTNGFTKM
ncbi:MAG: hypothetical protein HDR46_05245 [Bacteroides sp.]|nr:hypothetical protein [Bacteroides sp.]